MSEVKLSEFLETENIAYHKIWYYLRDSDGKKTPIGEKNNTTLEQALEKKSQGTSKPKSKVKKVKDVWEEIPFSEQESKSLTLAYTIFLKYTNNHYCIDIDDKEIESMDDFVAKTGCDKFIDCAWIQGNTKGIHIYAKIKNMIPYSDQQGVYNNFDGDLIRINNMWEKTTKKVNNYNGVLPEFEYEDIKDIFNHKISNKPKENKKKVVKEDETKQLTTNDEVVEIDNSNNGDYLLIKSCIESGLLTHKSSGYSDWRDVGFAIKHTGTDETYLNLFDTFSKLCPEKYNEENVKNHWNTLKDTSKKPLTIKSIVKWAKDKDAKQFSQISLDLYKKLKAIKKTDDIVEIDMTKTNKLDSNYFHTLPNYQMKKQYFEMFVSKVLRPEPIYIYIEGEKDIGKDSCLFSENNVKQAFRHLGSGKWKQKSQFEYVEEEFIDVWIKDHDIKCYNKLDFVPYNGYEPIQNNSDIYNLFMGYNPKIKTPYDKSNKDKILKPFKELGLELCGGDPKHWEYVYKYFAHLIQKPNERISICMIFKGKQGTGKNVFLNAIGNIVGKEHYITSSNPKDFFGDYAEGFYHKLLVNMNECEGKDTFDFEGKIKSFISEDTITINPKNVRPSTIRNVARTIIFTNKPNPIPIDVKSGDRRYCVFQTSDKYLEKKYGTKFWTKLVEHFNKPEFIACLYDDFNELDIGNTDWRSERPITEAYKEMCRLYVPVEALFLEKYIEDNKGCQINSLDDNDETDDETLTNESLYDKEKDINGKELYDEYVRFCKSNGFHNERTFQPNISKFYNRLSELELPILKIKTMGLNILRFTPSSIYNHLVLKKWINRNDEDKEIIVEDKEGEDFDDYFEV